MKQFASWFTHGVRNGAQLRKAIYHAQDERQILEEVERFFGRLPSAADSSVPLATSATATCGG
jgi:hypothetical protein